MAEGVVVPSHGSVLRVTQVLREAGLIDVQWIAEDARDRGSALHAATHYLDIGDLDRSSVDERVAPALTQYERFIAEMRPQILAVEEEVTNATFGYSGRLDRRVILNEREGVLDIKGVTRSAWHGVQLAAYAACFDRPLRRWSLHVTADDYRLIEHTDRDDWRAFQAALALVAWRRKHE